jgi:hypothetical protein
MTSSKLMIHKSVQRLEARGTYQDQDGADPGWRPIMSGSDALEDLADPGELPGPDPETYFTSCSEAKALSRDKGFETIWQGGIMTGCHLVLKLQISFNAKGRLLYNGRLYNRNSWSWRPPKFIRLQGREAKEEPNSRNSHPEIYLTTLNGEELKLDACPCGGELVKDRCECLYCRDCGLIYSHY